MFFGLNDVVFLAAVSAPALDPDAAAYIAAVEVADTQALEPAVRAAINDFVVGCKADGIWAAIKASCILAGARTLSGALVPLVGAAPTRFGTEGGWNYNRETGLQGNGINNHLDSNRNNNADPQDSQHLAVYASVVSAVSANQGVISTSSVAAGNSNLVFTTTGLFHRSRSATGGFIGSNPAAVGLHGISRAESAQYTVRTNGSSSVVATASDGLAAGTIEVYRRASTYLDSRLSFYSIGESLDLALLDARVTALINAFDAAI
jgi:hypothetical protein